MSVDATTVDAVVVGAGHNGLVAANLLADAGWEVVVLEATGGIGGAVRSAEVTAPGYSSDLCSAFYPMAACSPPLRSLHLEEYGLSWTHAPAVLAHALPDGRAAVLHRDPAATAASVEEFAAGDGESWLRVYAHWRAIADDVIGALFTPFPPVRPGLALLRRLRAAGMLRLARRFLLPARVLGEELFAGEGARLLLTGLALHTDLAPDQVGSGAFGWLLAMIGQQHGFPVPVGGAQRLADALAARLAKRGGQVVTDARVDRVVVGRGRALGVRCIGGRYWRARRAVLADVAAPMLYRDLVGAAHLPTGFVADLDRFHWDFATLKVDWALSAPLAWRAPEVAGAGTVHLGGDLDGLSGYATAVSAGRVPEHPYVLLGQMTTADPSRSPAGTESMWAYTHLPNRTDWPADEIEAHVARMERAIEQCAPGFRSVVVGRHVAGPRELWAHNPSLVGGAINAGTAAPYQQLVFRPVPGLGRADTPIDRLFLAGAAAHPGGGVHGGPGANAARAALARDRAVTGRVYAAAVGRIHRSLYA
jgi:phytoene dehydrogenase-like protein